MRFASLGSGSRGNSIIFEAAGSCFLIDCGFSVRETERRLTRMGIAAADLAGIFVTHEHSDHISGVAPLARKYRIPVWMTYGTFRVCRDKDIPEKHLFHPHQPLTIADFELQPFPVPHDAAEPCQVVVTQGGVRVGLLTDTGSVTPFITRSLQACDALILECNYDADMLARGPYPPVLQARIAGRYGHLENKQAAQLLSHVAIDRLQSLCLAHLSEKNNRPELAHLAISDAVTAIPISVCDQDSGLDWLEVI